MQAPLVKRTFELYASGRYSLKTLTVEMHRIGLRNRGGNRVSKTGFSAILNNPFYIGIIRLRRTGETFEGAHVPLVEKRTYDRLHSILTGKTNTRAIRHDFAFRRMFLCAICGRTLMGERQKGHAYYRCHTKGCTTIREEKSDEAILAALRPLVFSDAEKTHLGDAAAKLKASWLQERDNQTSALTLQRGKIDDRMERLTDAYLDQVLERDLFEKRKAALLIERKGIDEALVQMGRTEGTGPTRLQEFLELAGSA